MRGHRSERRGQAHKTESICRGVGRIRGRCRAGDGTQAVREAAACVLQVSAVDRIQDRFTKERSRENRSQVSEELNQLVELKMKRLSVIVLACVICAVPGYSQTPLAATPQFASEMFKTTGLDRQYEIVKHLNPSSLTGDFDGDGKTDIAVLVKQKSSKKI